jgi:hypothetical protein
MCRAYKGRKSGRKSEQKTDKRRRKDADEKKAPEGAFSGLLPSGFGR